MKLCKKKMAILATVCALLLVMVFVLCSFAPPSYPSTLTYFDASSLSRIDSENIYSIIYFQDFLGSLNSFQPVCCYISSTYCVLVLVTAIQSFDCAFVDNIFSFTYTGSWYYTAYLTSGGFSFIQRVSSNFNVVSSNVICYSLDETDSLHYNSSFVPSSSSSNGRDDISDVFNYWYNYYQLVSTDYESKFESYYNDGFSDGYESGYVDGFDTGFSYGEQFGYQDGYQDGIGTGYNDGYLAGEADGYDTGYSDGYQDGYDTGYSEAERETVIQYVEPFEIDIGRVISGISSVPDNIMNGSFDFELFGINVYGLLKLLIILFVVSAIVVFIIKRAS